MDTQPTAALWLFLERPNPLAEIFPFAVVPVHGAAPQAHVVGGVMAPMFEVDLERLPEGTLSRLVLAADSINGTCPEGAVLRFEPKRVWLATDSFVIDALPARDLAHARQIAAFANLEAA